ncbi:MAG: STAS domain-containing protein [Acidimicrobiales bacterium]
MAFEVAVGELTEQRALVQLSGEMDSHTAGAFAEAMSELTARPGVDVTIDASKLSFVDSSAITELLKAQRAVSAGGGMFRMIGVGSAVRRVIEITGLLDELNVGS